MDVVSVRGIITRREHVMEDALSYDVTNNVSQSDGSVVTGGHDARWTAGRRGDEAKPVPLHEKESAVGQLERTDVDREPIGVLAALSGARQMSARAIQVVDVYFYDLVLLEDSRQLVEREH